MIESVNLYIQKLVNLYSQHTDAEYAEWSKKYLRNQYEFLGIRTPIRRQLMKEFVKENGLPPKGRLKDVVFSLWDLPEREYQQAAFFSKFLFSSKFLMASSNSSDIGVFISSESYFS
ncbi:DNA alkylation repair protein [Bacillus songklensis]